MGRPESDGLDGWGSRDRERLERLAEAAKPRGRAFAARLTNLPPAQAADEIRAYFAFVASKDLQDAIANGLGLDPERAALISEEIAASRRRLERATRFRPIAARR